MLLVIAFSHVLVEICWISTHLLNELSHHVLEETRSAMTAMATTTTSAASTSTTTVTASSKVLGELLHEVLDVSLLSLLAILTFEDSDQDIRGSTSLLDLQEGVIVVEALFAQLTVVKVFADAALEADSTDWVDSTSVTGNVSVLNHILSEISISLWLLRHDTTEILRLQERVEDFSGLLLKL